MRRFATALLIPLCATAAQAPLPELRIEPTGGGSIFYVRNIASQPLTAFLIELVDYPGSYYAFWQDDVTSDPVAAGAEQRIRVANMTVGAAPDYVKVQAALYADGTTAGIPEKIAQLSERRRFELETSRELIDRLEKAQAAGTPKATVIADLKQWTATMRPAGKRKRDFQPGIDQAAAQSLIANAAASLETHSVEEALAQLRVSLQRASQNKPAP